MNPYYEIQRDETPDIMLFDQQAGTVSSHFHQKAELYFVTGGTIRTTVNNRTRDLTTGQCSFSDSFDIHSYHNIENGTAHVMMLPVYYLQNYFKYKSRRHLNDYFITDTNACAEILATMQRLHSTAPKNELQLQGLIDGVLGTIIQCLGLTDHAPGSDIHIARNILLYLSENFLENLSLQSTADKFGYSKNYFSALFNRFFKCSFSDYVNSLRIRHYQSSKNYERLTVLEAAYMSGFSSAATFYRAYKKFSY